jgi:aryl-alcohol dehydrogenase-like predicted oxidoreductase
MRSCAACKALLHKLRLCRFRALLVRSPVMMPIPGTSKVKHLEENVAAAELKIDANEMQELNYMARASQEPAATA